METLEEFKTMNMPKRTGKGNREIKITGSWGVYDIYKHIRKNGWYDIGRPLKEHEFYTIIRQVNLLLAEEIALGHEVRFPELMGRLELRKYPKGVRIKDGNLKNTYPIDWGETWKLWYEDAEAFKERILVRDEQPMVYHVKYCKQGAKYQNKLFYQFQLGQKLKKKLKENIKKGITDTLW